MKNYVNEFFPANVIFFRNLIRGDCWAAADAGKRVVIVVFYGLDSGVGATDSAVSEI